MSTVTNFNGASGNGIHILHLVLGNLPARIESHLDNEPFPLVVALGACYHGLEHDRNIRILGVPCPIYRGHIDRILPEFYDSCKWRTKFVELNFKIKHNPRTYYLKFWSWLLWSKQWVYCSNSPLQVFFTFRRNSNAQLVKALPSFKHFLGSFSSVRHNRNSCTKSKQTNVNTVLVDYIILWRQF